MRPKIRAHAVVLLPFISLLVLCGNPSTNGAMTDAESVAADTATLQITFAAGDTISNVTHSVILPTLGPSGTTISWSSSQPATLSDAGVLLQSPAASTEVILTAIIAKGSVRDTKAFFLTVTASTG